MGMIPAAPWIPASHTSFPPTSVIPAHAGTQSKANHATFLPFAKRRGRVRSTQGMLEIQSNHHLPSFPLGHQRGGKTTPPHASPCASLRSTRPPSQSEEGATTSPSPREGDACKARRGCSKFKATTTSRHSRARGNPE